MSEAELRDTRTSDTVFVLGSGPSINDLSPYDWEHIAAGNTISFNRFFRQQFVRVDYHLTAEVIDYHELAGAFATNPRYSATVHLIQEGWWAIGGNTILGRRLLPKSARIFRFRRRARGRYSPPSESFANGLSHGFGTVIDVVNFAYLVGWKNIVLVGVDLYDKRYFWLREGETDREEIPGLTYRSPFPGGRDTVSMLARWSELLLAKGVSMQVFSQKSLLAEVVPIFQW